MITYVSDKSPKYPARTVANAIGSDATIAFAADFTTAGEKLTRQIVERNNKPYIAINIFSLPARTIADVVKIIIVNKVKTLNIAGNSLPTLLHHGISQEICDDVVYGFLKKVFAFHKPYLIRSGGQSGADEAGIKAAVKIGIPALIHCTSNYKFVNEIGGTICNEYAFKKRFG